MKAAVLIRTGSGPTQLSLALGSPGRPSPDASGISFLGRSRSSSALLPRSLHFEARDTPPTFRRARSEASIFGSDGRIDTRVIPEKITEEVEEEVETVERRVLLGLGISDRAARIWTGTGTDTVPEEVEFSGGGMGKGRKTGRGGRGGEEGGGDKNGMGAYYQEMLKADPGNPLFLRNYGKYLHEVEGDMERAEEYYGRAILASPADGEVLSLYGKLIWEAHRDDERAGEYFERAVKASPEDCFVLGSYAHFLWDAEEDDEEGGRESSELVESAISGGGILI